MTKFIFWGGRGAYVDLFYVPAELLHYFFVHNLFKKKDGRWVLKLLWPGKPALLVPKRKYHV